MGIPTYQTWGDAIASVLARAGMSRSELARRLRDRGYPIDASRVSKWTRGVEIPGDIRIFPAIEDETGARRGTIFKSVGLVDDGLDVIAAINADPGLTDTAKKAVIGVYEGFLKMSAGAAMDSNRPARPAAKSSARSTR